jgi:hypothetical protein
VSGSHGNEQEHNKTESHSTPSSTVAHPAPQGTVSTEGICLFPRFCFLYNLDQFLKTHLFTSRLIQIKSSDLGQNQAECTCTSKKKKSSFIRIEPVCTPLQDSPLGFVPHFIDHSPSLHLMPSCLSSSGQGSFLPKFGHLTKSPGE